MPIIYCGRVERLLDQKITKMSVRELIHYEAELWRWMDKTKGTGTIALQLNAVHREIEWRAQEKEWRDAAHP
jgi:hypothetical protein